ncbi:MAG: glycosyltransferase [Rhodospirillaceae bacterium]
MGSVSFVVTVYNKAPFLPLVIESLKAQTGLDDPEFIFVDDGSTDDSREVLERLTADWPNICLITQANAGPSAATNRGVAEATRPWIKLVDGDDVLAPHATARLLGAASTLDTQFAYCNIEQADTEACHRLLSATPTTVAPILQSDPLQLLSKKMFFNPTCMLARTDLMREAGGCDTRVFIQDYSIALRMAARTAFAYVPETLALAPVEDGELARASGNKAQILHDLNLVMANFLDDHPDLSITMRTKMIRRAVSRAWKWHRRQNAGGILSAPFLDLVRSALPSPPPALVHRSCAVFRQAPRAGVTHNLIRVMQA